MELRIAEKLKELRRERGNTQEDIANHLGISVQAISKWERGDGLPDITMLPGIASFYDVSVDLLLGCDEIRQKECVDEYVAKNHEIWVREPDRKKQAEKRIGLWREAQRKYPNNHIVLMYLMGALSYPHWKPSDNYNEIIQIGERILAESTDAVIRADAIYTMCNVCALQKDIENAKRYAEMMPSFNFSREILYGRCLSDDEKQEYRQKCIVEFIRTIYSVFIQDLYGVAGGRRSCSPEGYTSKMCEFALSLFKSLYPDGDYGDDEHWVAAICNVLAVQYAGEDNEKSLYYLEETVNHYVKYYTQGEFRHTSYTVDRLVCHGLTISKDELQRRVKQDLNGIENSRDLEPIRNDKRYTVAVEKLKRLSE